MRPPSTVDAGKYPVSVHVASEGAQAATRLALDITGEPKLSLSGRDGLLSASAVAGKQSSVPVIVNNTGTAPAEDVTLSGTAPNGWKVSFEPKRIDRIAPKERKQVQARITPPDNAIAGDYAVGVTSSTRGETQSTW